MVKESEVLALYFSSYSSYVTPSFQWYTSSGGTRIYTKLIMRSQDRIEELLTQEVEVDGLRRRKLPGAKNSRPRPNSDTPVYPKTLVVH